MKIMILLAGAVVACSSPLPEAPTDAAPDAAAVTAAPSVGLAQVSAKHPLAPPPCTVTVEAAHDPYVGPSGPTDGTRWLRATYNDKACGSTEPEWSIEPAEGWHGQAMTEGWFRDPFIAWTRGECGEYKVRARAPDAGAESLPVKVTLYGGASWCPPRP